MLYVLSSCFVVYLVLGQKVGGALWAVLFWIIVLFASVNAITKSFIQEDQKRQLYYYTLMRPSVVIVSKIIYNAFLLLLINLLAFLCFAFITGNPIKYLSLFLQIIVLGSLGFAIAFTFVSAISSKAQQSATLMTILSFPVIIPILLILMRLTKIALGLMSDSAYYKDVLILIALDVILFSLSLLLFPLLWRD